MAFIRTCLCQRTYQSVFLTVNGLIKKSVEFSKLAVGFLAVHFTLRDLVSSFEKGKLTQKNSSSSKPPFLLAFFSENWFLEEKEGRRVMILDPWMRMDAKI